MGLEWLGITMEHDDIPKELLDEAYDKADELRQYAKRDFDMWLAEHGLECRNRTLQLL